MIVHLMIQVPGEKFPIVACLGAKYGDRKSKDPKKVTCKKCLRTMTECHG